MHPVAGGKRLESGAGVEHDMAKRRRYGDDDENEDAPHVMEHDRESDAHGDEQETTMDGHSPGTPGEKDMHPPAEDYMTASSHQHLGSTPTAQTEAIAMVDNHAHPSRSLLGVSDDSLQRAAREMRDAVLETNVFVKALCADMRTVMKEMATLSDLKRNFAEFKTTIVQLLGNVPGHADVMTSAAPVLPESTSDIRQVVKECPKWKVYTERLRFNCLDSLSEERLRRFVRPTAAELLADIVGRGKFSEADVELVVGLLRTSLTGTRQNYKKYIRVYIRDHFVANGAIDRPPQEEDVRSIVAWLLSRLYKGISERELWSKTELIEDMRKLVCSEWGHADRVKECRLQLSMVGGGGSASGSGHAASMPLPPPASPPSPAAAAGAGFQRPQVQHHAADLLSTGELGARSGHGGAVTEAEPRGDVSGCLPGLAVLGDAAVHAGDVSAIARDGLEDLAVATDRMTSGLEHGQPLVNEIRGTSDAQA